MKKIKLNWYVVDKNYVEYLQKFDSKVQNIEYGNKEVKPYIGIVLQVNNFDYYVPISSVKPKHYKMRESRDLILIKDNQKILSAINLNNMIPVFPNEIDILRYSEIHNYREFQNTREKINYISLLNREIRIINNKKDEILQKAIKVYNEKINYPESKLSKRCCDFQLLEEKSIEYLKDKEERNLENNIEDDFEDIDI